jgi:O-antigen ligase
VFSGEISDLRRVWISEPPLVAIGTVTGIAATAMLVSPRLATIFFPLIVLLWIWAQWGQSDLRAALPKADGRTLSFAALLLFALLSSLWSEIPGAAVHKIAALGAVTFASLMTVNLVAGESRQGIVRAGEGLWLGFLIGLIYYCAEAATNQGLRIWFFNAFDLNPAFLQPEKSLTWSDGRLVAINDAALTRAATPITLLLWPAILAAQGAIVSPWNKRIALTILAIAVPTTFFSPQETSKMALLVGLGAFGIAWLSRRWALRLLATAWVIACLAIVTVALLAHRLELHRSAWLQSSAQHRIIIWNYTSEHVMRSPILGIGAFMTYLTGLDRSADAVQDEKWGKSLSRHAHNFFLQTWLELGAVGAVLLLLAGLQVIRRIGQMTHDVQPYAFATFTSAFAMISASYGIWQGWLMCLLGLTPILFAVGARAFETSRPDMVSQTGAPASALG